MAKVNKGTSGAPSVSSLEPTAGHRIIGDTGEAVEAGDACRVRNDGKIVRSLGAAANANANVHGFADRTAAAGKRITLFIPGERMWYAPALTPGISLYLDDVTPGALNDAPTAGGTAPVAHTSPDGQKIQIVQGPLR